MTHILQQDLNRITVCSKEGLLSFNPSKCKFMYLGRGKPKTVELSLVEEKDLGN